MKVYFTPSQNMEDGKSFIFAQHLMDAAQALNFSVVFQADEADIIIELNDEVNKNINYQNKKIALLSPSTAFHHLKTALQQSIDQAKVYSEWFADKNLETKNTKHIVAVTACPSGVTQTFMSAEAIADYAKSQGWDVKVEARGNIGANNIISDEDVALADLVFVATDINVDLSKFKGKPMYKTSTLAALKHTEEEFNKAFNEAQIYTGEHKTKGNRKNKETKYGKCAVKKGAHRISFLIILAIFIGLLLMYLQS